jgi:hypothetical protein
LGKLQRRVESGLTLYVRHMAWLNAVPKPDPRSRRGKAEENAPPRLSRLDELKRKKITPVMPPNPAPALIARLIEIGLTEGGGMAPVPLSWGAINEWAKAVEVDVEPWEKRLMRALSVEYIAESRRAERESCPAPWRAPVVTQAEREAEVDALRALLD